MYWQVQRLVPWCGQSHSGTAANAFWRLKLHTTCSPCDSRAAVARATLS